MENINLRTDYSLQRYHKASIRKLGNCWYAKLNLKVQEINMHFPRYFRISKSSGEGCIVRAKRKLSDFLPKKIAIVAFKSPSDSRARQLMA